MDPSYFMSRLILRPVQSKGGGAPKIHREALQPPRGRGPKHKWGNPRATQTQDSHPWFVRILDHHPWAQQSGQEFSLGSFEGKELH